ncbi:MAG: hypothetical protein LBT49_03365 [Prevotellaceae bacterium]|jgi:hypothetical protein|nr:hypothetical protein [Prevotellaceae bacterium]
MKTFTSLLSVALFLLLLFSLFKNISYQLLWNDESMTAVGAEVVLEYGYPKVHGEKNVFYDLLHTNPTLGVNEKDDAFAGSSGWDNITTPLLATSWLKKQTTSMPKPAY